MGLSIDIAQITDASSTSLHTPRSNTFDATSTYSKIDSTKTSDDPSSPAHTWHMAAEYYTKKLKDAKFKSIRKLTRHFESAMKDDIVMHKLFKRNCDRYESVIKNICKIGWCTLDHGLLNEINNELEIMMLNVETIWELFVIYANFTEQQPNVVQTQNLMSTKTAANYAFEKFIGSEYLKTQIAEGFFPMNQSGTVLFDFAGYFLKSFIVALVVIFINPRESFSEENWVSNLSIVLIFVLLQAVFWLLDMESSKIVIASTKENIYLKLLYISAQHVTVLSKIVTCRKQHENVGVTSEDQINQPVEV